MDKLGEFKVTVEGEDFGVENFEEGIVTIKLPSGRIVELTIIGIDDYIMYGKPEEEMDDDELLAKGLI
jgi:hypothetical protein